MLFQQTAAPTGWTKQTTHNDKTLRVVSGTASSGGTTAFTSVFTSRAVSGSVNNTTLTTAQMPSHSHTITTNYSFYSGNRVTSSDGSYTNHTGGTNAAGSSNAHNHGFTGTAMDFDVQYVDLIIASKD
jgi:microcystin-dependent protein